MSSQTVVFNNGQQANITTDTTKVFLWNRRSQKASINNATYDPITYPEGTVIGRISASGLIKPFTSGASDGSQFPIGVIIGSPIVGAGETDVVEFCDDGDVNQNKLIFQGSDTLNTVVSGRTVKDHLKLYGIKVIASDQMTKADNA